MQRLVTTTYNNGILARVLMPQFAFNGKEKDNETYGDGNEYDYGFRIYNTRLGRFLSVDPLTREYPWYTPYQFAGNTPIWAMDLDGMEEAYATDHCNEKTGQCERTYVLNRSAKPEDKGCVQFKYSDGTESSEKATPLENKIIGGLHESLKNPKVSGTGCIIPLSEPTTAPSQPKEATKAEQPNVRITSGPEVLKNAQESIIEKKATTDAITTYATSESTIVNHVKTNQIAEVNGQGGIVKSVTMTVESYNPKTVTIANQLKSELNVPVRIESAKNPIPGNGSVPDPEIAIHVNYEVKGKK